MSPTVHARSPLPVDRFLLARLTEIKGLDEPVFDAGEPCVRFVFQVLEEPHAGRIAIAVAPSVLEPGNRLQRLLQQMGMSAAPGRTIDIAPLIGATFMIRVGPPTNGSQPASDPCRV